MIYEASEDIKTLFSNIDIIDLDVGQEINTYGNYLVFDSFTPDGFAHSGEVEFTLFMALKTLKRGNKNAYADLDEIIERLANSAEQHIVCDCRGIKLNQFGERLFIYAINLRVTRS